MNGVIQPYKIHGDQYLIGGGQTPIILADQLIEDNTSLVQMLQALVAVIQGTAALSHSLTHPLHEFYISLVLSVDL